VVADTSKIMMSQFRFWLLFLGDFDVLLLVDGELVINYNDSKVLNHSTVAILL
jgi:hypothetical protein